MHMRRAVKTVASRSGVCLLFEKIRFNFRLNVRSGKFMLRRADTIRYDTTGNI